MTPIQLKKNISGSLLFMGILILGAFLRLYHLGDPSLWLDEAISFFRGQMSLTQIVQASYGWDVHPPTYYLILHFIEKLGNSEFAVRFFSALCGIASLPVLFHWVKIQFGKQEAIWAVFFQACSIFHIQYSQEARVYALFYLSSLFVMLYFYQALTSGKRKYWMFWSIFSIINFYVHYYSLILLAAQVLYFLGTQIFRRVQKQKLQRIPQFLLSSFIIIVGCLPQIFSFISQAATKVETGQSFWRVSNPIQFGLIFLRNQVNPVPLSYSFLDRGLKYLFLLLLTLAIGICWKKMKESVYPISVLILSLLLGWISSFFIYFSGTFRYLIFLGGPFCVLLGVSMVSISEHLEIRMSRLLTDSEKVKRSILILLIMIFGSIQLFLVTEYYQAHRKPDWRKGFAMVAEIGKSGDVVIPIPGYSDYVSRYYLMDKPKAPKVKRINGLTLSMMDSLKMNHRRVFFITDGQLPDQVQQEQIEKWLGSHTKQIWVDKNFSRSAIWITMHDLNDLPPFLKKFEMNQSKPAS